jgi:hypothetical protein
MPEPVPDRFEPVRNVFETAGGWFADARSMFVDFRAPRLPEKCLLRRLFPARPAARKTFFQLRIERFRALLVLTNICVDVNISALPATLPTKTVITITFIVKLTLVETPPFRAVGAKPRPEGRGFGDRFGRGIQTPSKTP